MSTQVKGTISRRLFLQSSGILLSCFTQGRVLSLTPAEAYAADIPLQVLSTEEADTLEVVAEGIVPGARSLGIVQYIDKQLAASTDESLLMLKFLNVPAPFDGFYQDGLQAAAEAALHSCHKKWSALNADESAQLLTKISKDKVPDWQGPPASFFFFVLRADACDVVYGTQQGFADIGMPYMAHIAPAQNW